MSTASALPGPAYRAAAGAGTARRVTTFTAACLLVSNSVGSGIFTTTGFMARDLGHPGVVLALWGLGGLLALAGAMSYAELGAALPRSGGEYVYLRRSFGPLVGFLGGWTSFTLGFGAPIAAAAVSFALFLLELLPEGFALRDPRALALLLVWGLTAVHLRGVGPGGRLQRWLTIGKIGGLVALIAAALAWGSGHWEHLTIAEPAGEPGLGGVFVALVFVLYSYSGWNAAGYIAGEIRDPGRSLPRAMIGGTVFVSVLYLCVNAIYFYALPASELAAEPVVPVAKKAASALFGEGGASVVTALLCFSIAGATSAMIWSGPRVYYAMAQDGGLPRVFARSRDGLTPTWSLALQSVWVTALVLTGTFEALIVYSGVALALFSAFTVASVLVLRVREPDLPRPYRVGLYPWVPLLYVGAALLIVGYGLLERPVEASLAAATILAGIPLYYWWRRR